MNHDPSHRKFLVIQTASIGDVILATSLLEKLHDSFPESSIDLLCKKGCESLFIDHPFIRKLLTWDKTAGKYSRLMSLLKQVRRERYDTVVDIHRFASSGFLTTFSRAKMKCGFSMNPFSLFFDIRVQHRIGKKWPKHEVERNQELIRTFAPGDAGKIKLYPQAADFAAIQQYTGKPFITIAPASLWFTKQFPQEKWQEFLALARSEYLVYFLGSDKDRTFIDSVFIKSENLINLAGKLSLLQTAALMESAVMNFTNDSAPLHLASARNSRITAIFCSTIPEFGFGPLSDDALVVQVEEDLKCKPCGIHGRRQCPEKHMKCGYDIQVSKLINRIHNG